MRTFHVGFQRKVPERGYPNVALSERLMDSRVADFRSWDELQRSHAIHSIQKARAGGITIHQSNIEDDGVTGYSRVKSRNSGRRRQGRVATDHASQRDCSELKYSSVKDSEYVPAEELVTLIYNAIVKDGMAGDFLKRAGFPVAPFRFQSMGELREQLALLNSVRNYVAESVSDFLATIGRGLARGENESLILTEKGVFRDVVLKGFIFRMPIGLQYLSSFARLLQKDIARAASLGVLDNQFSKLSFENGEVVLVRTVTIGKPQPSDWVRATVFTPE